MLRIRALALTKLFECLLHGLLKFGRQIVGIQCAVLVQLIHQLAELLEAFFKRLLVFQTFGQHLQRFAE